MHVLKTREGVLLFQQVHFRAQSWAWLRRAAGPVQRGRPVRAGLCVLIYASDLLLGLALCALALGPTCSPAHLDCVGVVTGGMASFTASTSAWSRGLILWTMGTPGGLKLNAPLDEMLGSRFLYISQLWEDHVYRNLTAPGLSNLVLAIATGCCGGVSLGLAALHDLLSLLNFSHLCFHVIMRRVLLLQLSGIRSLARLFMGKKWDVLRLRVDSCHYDTSQLLMGTLLFTILLFLVPTVATYYSAFLLVRLLVFLVQACLRACVVAGNRLMLWLVGLLEDASRDQPLSKLRVDVRVRHHVRRAADPPDGQGLGARGDVCHTYRGEAPVVVDVVTTAHWNGKALTLCEAKSLVESCDGPGLLRGWHPQAQGPRLSPDSAAEPNFTHSMLHWLSRIPF